MVQRVGIAIVDFLIDIIHEFVRNNFQEVKVVVGMLFWAVFEFFVYFSILHEHVEDGVLAVVDGAKCVHDDFLLAFVAKCNRIDLMVHLHLISILIIPPLHPSLSPGLVCLNVATLAEVKLACDFRNIKGTLEFALHLLFKKLIN